MRVTRTKILRIALPVSVLVLFYASLFWLSREKAKVIAQPRPNLTAEQSEKLLERSKTLFGEGKYREALPPTLVLCEAYPHNHIYLEQAAEIYDRLGNYREEAAYWERYLDDAPRPETGCPQIGEAYWKQGEAGETKAISAFERCLAFDPNSPDSILYLAHALEMSGNLDQAAELYQRGIKISPNYFDLRLGLARVWLHEGKYQAALKIAHEVLAMSPNNVDALLVAGLDNLREGNLPMAKEYLERGVKMSEGYTDFHVALGEVAERQNDIREAIRQYATALDLDPSDDSVRARLEALKKDKP